MILQKLEPYVRDYLQKEWSDYWKVTYNENKDQITCIWNSMDSTEINFTFDAEEEDLLFLSKEPQPVTDLVDMLSFLNNKVKELENELEEDANIER